ncbi:MAG: histidine kinase, partial [Dehalococcoidia bacterium]
MRSSTGAGMNAASGSLRPALDADAFSCEWDRDLHAVGLTTGLPAAYRIGISAFALAMLAGAILTAFLASDAGADPGLIGLALVLVAGAPWARWAVLSDNGPSWPFAAFVVVPVAVLGIGRWTDGPIGLDSGTAYYLATMPALPLTLLYAGFAPPRMAAGVLTATFGAFWVSPLAGWIWAEESVALTTTLVWSAGFALCVAAGCAVRLSYVVNRSLTEAREALAWQAAADQRRRIAQDVHDVVAHTLAITMLHITAARMAVRRSSPAEAEEALEEAERHGRASLNDIRR